MLLHNKTFGGTCRFLSNIFADRGPEYKGETYHEKQSIFSGNFYGGLRFGGPGGMLAAFRNARRGGFRHSRIFFCLRGRRQKFGFSVGTG